MKMNFMNTKAQLVAALAPVLAVLSSIYSEAASAVSGVKSFAEAERSLKSKAKGQGAPTGLIIGVFTIVVIIITLGVFANKLIANVPVDNDVFGIEDTTKDFGPTLVVFMYLLAMILVIAGAIYVIRRIRG